MLILNKSLRLSFKTYKLRKERRERERGLRKEEVGEKGRRFKNLEDEMDTR